MNVPRSLHGHVRGAGETPKSPRFEGRFGRMFRSLPSAEFDEGNLFKLGEKMISPEKEKDESKPDPDENPRIPAGYTYLGQFIDHDLTFDPVLASNAKTIQKQ